MITRTFTIEESLYESFQISCIRSKTSVSEKIRDLIKSDMEKEKVKSEKKESNQQSF